MERFPKGKNSILLQTLVNGRKSFIRLAPRVVFAKLHILSNLRRFQNKLKCYIALGCKGLLATNTLAYWVHSYFKKKMKCCECEPKGPMLQNFLRPYVTNFCNKLERLSLANFYSLV